jgi:hypothetical protein
MSRHGNKWNVNELLNLQREFELLGLSVREIADLHGRSVNAIQFRLVDEGFATWDQLAGYTVDDNSECSTEATSPDTDTESEVNKLADRVWSLETSVSDISAMVKQMFNSMVYTKNNNSTITTTTTTTNKRASLRSSV